MTKYEKYKVRREKLLKIRQSKERKVRGMEEIENFTRGLNFLYFADGDEFDSLDKGWASYGHDEKGVVCCIAVGPTFGPLRIYGPNALKAFNRLEDCNE